ncbi:hypothetical protein AALO_G00170970 [Alosa alosa]|uniref:Secreted protein n=1 Tax=Alosa alosa TaxID=278164 RepID=A0AAV6GGG9_9TELE|nr:hypothetical protein AALO_G00170970 [Alosa alosa]
MDPAVLIFLLYVMIAHELVCGWMQYRREAAKPRKRAALMWCSSSRVCQGTWRVSSQSMRTDRGRDWRKSGRIVRKA